MKNTDKNVYILGAGFSKEIGLPLQDDFLLKAKEVYHRNSSKYEYFGDVFKYQDKLSRMRQFLNYPLLNLEHLFNLMEMDVFYSKNNDVSNVKKSFVNLICDVLMELTPSPFYHDENDRLRTVTQYDVYLPFLKLFIRDAKNQETHEDTIITFNYDLVIEAAAALYNRNMKGGLRFNTTLNTESIIQNPVGDFFIRNGEPAYFYNAGSIFHYQYPAIKLLKLHGSINWKYKGRNETFIVPPTWNKSDPQISQLWESAYQELSEAKRIIIIGYSFPETDIYVKSLLALALNENHIIQNIYFINPDKANTKSMCLSLLDKYFERYCEYKEWKFSEFISDGRTFAKENLNRNM